VAHLLCGVALRPQDGEILRVHTPLHVHGEAPCAETAKEIIDETISVLGGYGYFLEQDVERRYRDNRIIEIYEGTVEVQLNNMARLLRS